jgi:ATP-binding cassette subfamily B protein
MRGIGLVGGVLSLSGARLAGSARGPIGAVGREQGDAPRASLSGNLPVKNYIYFIVFSQLFYLPFANMESYRLTWAQSKSSWEQMETAARNAQIHDFIMSLPDGYDTMLGENGARLSGGEKQRISIARAFLKDAPILLLDEVTSNVDPLNEVLIQKAIGTLSKGRTVLMIAHHLQMARSADNILVFDAGRISEIGTHDELLMKGGVYERLWNAQAEAREWGVA